MQVRCISDYLTPEQRAALGRRPIQGFLERRLMIGEEYLVLGLTFEFDPEHATTGPYVHVLRSNGDVALYVALCDLALFEITDPHASQYWQVRSVEFDNRRFIDVLPPELFSVLSVEENDERDGLTQDEAFFAALKSDEFKHICSLLQNEYRQSGEQKSHDST